MRRSPGQVRDAITAYLRTRGKDGATVEEIHNAAQETIGEHVASSSVRSYLNINTPERFERVARGTYRLR